MNVLLVSDGYRELLPLLAKLDIANVAPVQLAIRLLVTQGSRPLELSQVCRHLGNFDAARLWHPSVQPDARVEPLFTEVKETVRRSEAEGEQRPEIFQRIWHLAHGACGCGTQSPWRKDTANSSVSEPWYCCAEPLRANLARS